MIEKEFWGLVDFRQSYADKIAAAKVDKEAVVGLLQATTVWEEKHKKRSPN